MELLYRPGVAVFKYINKNLTIADGSPIDEVAAIFTRLSKDGVRDIDSINKEGLLVILSPEISSESDGINIGKAGQPGYLFIRNGQIKTFDTNKGELRLSYSSQGFLDVNSNFFEDLNTELSGLPKELLHWVAMGNRGASSNYMADTLFNYPKCQYGGELKDFDHAYPSDSDDFRRCHEFLEAVPEAKHRFLLMAKQSDAWGDLTYAWQDLTDAYLNNDYTGVSKQLDEIIYREQNMAAS